MLYITCSHLPIYAHIYTLVIVSHIVATAALSHSDRSEAVEHRLHQALSPLPVGMVPTGSGERATTLATTITKHAWCIIAGHADPVDQSATSQGNNKY